MHEPATSSATTRDRRSGSSGHLLEWPDPGAGDWQAKAIELIAAANADVVLASPRREYLDGDFDYARQVDWETHYRKLAEQGANLFWLAKEATHDHNRAFAQTSRAELFESKERYVQGRGKLVVGTEPGFSGARYIQRRFSQDCPDVPICNTLEATCKAALDLITSASHNR